VTTLVVKEEIIQDDRIMLIGADISQFDYYARSTEIPGSVRDALRKAGDLKRAISATDADVAAHTARINEITVEQNRIRENMKTVTPSGGGQYYERLLTKLNEQESTIETLQAERAGLITKSQDQRRAYEDYVSQLTIG